MRAGAHDATSAAVVIVAHQVGLATVAGLAIAVTETSLAGTDVALSCHADRGAIRDVTDNPAPAAVIGVSLRIDALAAAQGLPRITNRINRAGAAHAAVSSCTVRIVGATGGAGGRTVTNERDTRRRAGRSRRITRAGAYTSGQGTALARARTVRVATHSLAANSAGTLGVCAAGLAVAAASRCTNAGNTGLTGLAGNPANAAVVWVAGQIRFATVVDIVIAIAETCRALLG